MRSGPTTSETFLFADIAGFTALTEAHGDAEAAELAVAFCRDLSAIAHDRGGEAVKTIGDAVMLRHRDAGEAVRLGLTAVHEVIAGHGFPAVRVGVHSGPAVSHNGDWFGAAVNLAARVAGLAAGGEVIVTGAVRSAAAEIPLVRYEPRGEHRVRNVASRVQLFAAVPTDAKSHKGYLDPVCRMLVEEGREAGTLEHRGNRYRFCSLECAGRFASDPEVYASSS